MTSRGRKWMPRFASQREQQIIRTARFGGRATDPEMAWFVCQHAHEGIRDAWGNVIVIGVAVAFLVGMIIVSGGWTEWTTVVAVFILVALVIPQILYRRALRLNEPIARPPRPDEGPDEALPTTSADR